MGQTLRKGNRFLVERHSREGALLPGINLTDDLLLSGWSIGLESTVEYIPPSPSKSLTVGGLQSTLQEINAVIHSLRWVFL